MTLVVSDKNVKAFINDAKEPSLDLIKLTDRQNGKIGIFVGDGSGGDFRNVYVKYNNE